MEGEHELCLVEPLLELGEEMLLQVQMQLMEEMQDMEALVAVVAEEVAVEVIHRLPLIPLQQEMEALAELVVMGAEVVMEEGEGAPLLTTKIFQEQEVQEVLAVLGEEVEAAEMLERAIMVVMVQQEAMAEVEGVVVSVVLLPVALEEVMVAAALAALD